MTPAQKAVYDAIKALTERRHIPPTVREICGEIRLSSTSTVHSHLVALKRQGYITYTHGHVRTIRVTACTLGDQDVA